MHAKFILFGVFLFVGVLGSPKPQVPRSVTTSIYTAEPTAVTTVTQYNATTATSQANSSVFVITHGHATTVTAVAPAITTISAYPIASNVTNSTDPSPYTTTFIPNTVNATSTLVQTSPINATVTVSSPVNTSSPTISPLPINAVNKNSADGGMLHKALGAGAGAGALLALLSLLV